MLSKCYIEKMDWDKLQKVVDNSGKLFILY